MTAPSCIVNSRWNLAVAQTRPLLPILDLPLSCFISMLSRTFLVLVILNRPSLWIALVPWSTILLPLAEMISLLSVPMTPQNHKARRFSLSLRIPPSSALCRLFLPALLVSSATLWNARMTLLCQVLAHHTSSRPHLPATPCTEALRHRPLLPKNLWPSSRRWISTH